MTSTKYAALLCAAIITTAALTACGPKQPTPTLTQPPTPVQPGAAIPFTPVKQPLDLTSFEKAPCQILTKEQVAAVVADPPSDVRPTLGDNSAAVGCNWISRSGPLVIISEPLAGPVNLAELAASRPTSTHNLEPWSEVSLDGYPTVVYHQGSGPDDCDVAVGVSDTKMLHVSYGGDGTPSRYWDKNRCGGVLKTADFVLNNLRHH
ncbi:DUF3558 domain-containing protein [Amycolatopsis saalfeldensis]|uniref:DUF3558 domain-containing protein n=1 Tax=Amycolatopsis saalfeldensis TaxID=394193 RepID=A0A1H8Y5B7_9PSEU|nr:DUF3558 domain-containing protein [Amycolatopsis saalfeldensis]SEP47276.1 Protein of unknown function [Amycolatopsis saalfeldensis]